MIAFWRIEYNRHADLNLINCWEGANKWSSIYKRGRVSLYHVIKVCKKYTLVGSEHDTKQVRMFLHHYLLRDGCRKLKTLCLMSLRSSRS